MLFLLRRQEARTITERTDILQGRYDRRPDKLGAIGNVSDDFQETFIDLEGYDCLLLLHCSPRLYDVVTLLLSNTSMSRPGSFLVV